MSRLLLLLVLLVGLIGAVSVSADNLLNEPEGIAYDTVNHRYLVSNWRNGTVVAIDTNGVQEYLRTGLGNCASIHISGDTVFVPLDNEAVVGLDLETGVTVTYNNFPSAGGCHDVTVDTSGFMYATDWRFNRIFKVRLSDNTTSFLNITGPPLLSLIHI